MIIIGENMKKNHYIYFIIFIVVIIILSFKDSSQTKDVSASLDGEIVEYEEILVVESTSNLFSKLGLKLNNIICNVFSYIFIIINKIISFILGL